MRYNRKTVPDEVKARSGVCECGCGERTAIAAVTDTARDRYAGYPARFVRGHFARTEKWRNDWRVRTRHPRVPTPDGYYKVRMPEHPNANRRGYVLEHRLVMAQTIGRALMPYETVHHINGDRADNRPENLQLRNGMHGPGVLLQCNACGSHDVAPIPITSTENAAAR